jgi:Arc/MetJ-type ribon-helix-helix transcriptional regulator
MATLTISLPKQIANKIDSEAEKLGFSTRSEFIRSILRKHFSEDELKFEPFEARPIDEIKLELAKTGKYSQDFIESVTKGLAKSSRYGR